MRPARVYCRRYRRAFLPVSVVATLVAFAVWIMVTGVSINGDPSCPLIDHLTVRPFPRPAFRVDLPDDEFPADDFPDVVIPDRPREGSRTSLDNERD